MGTIQRKRVAIPHVRPEGGYRLISVAQLFWAWWAYRQGEIEFRDLRAYFALHEMSSRRCMAGQGRTPRYTATEVQNLVGGQSVQRVRASLRKLNASGLAKLDSTSLTFAERPEELQFDLEGFEPAFTLIANRRRRVPVPRRTVRLLARASKPVLVATVLGHLFRCVYAKGLLVAGEGSISASWIAEVFGVDARNVKRARAELENMGWLQSIDCDHWHRQRYGQRISVNLAWNPMKAESPSTLRRLPLQSPPTDTVLPLPYRKQELLNGLRNQKPAAGAAGICSSREVQSKAEPNLRNIQRRDLTDPDRVLCLYRQACGRNLIGSSEHERLQFASAARRAIRVATRNPGGLFSRLVCGGLWHYSSADDESTAQAMLKRHLYDRPHRPQHSVSPPRPTSVPDARFFADVRIVSSVTRAAQTHGYRGDPFDLLSNQDSTWTRPRWEAALRAWLHPP